MDWDLIKSVQEDLDLRLILPFGLNLHLGDVISVDRSGNFSLEGSAQSLLGVALDAPRPPAADVDLYRTVGDNASVEFHPAGQASTLFPNLPAASAKIDIEFQSAKSWTLALVGRKLSSLDELNGFRQAILSAYSSGVWKPDWALVTTIGTADAMTLLAAETSDTKIGLTLSGTVDAGAAMQAKLTAGATVAAASNEITQCLLSNPAPVACTALRVRDRWWQAHPDVTDLRDIAPPTDAMTAPDTEFWEPMDDGLN